MKTNIFTLFFILYTAAAITAQTDTSANMQPTKSWAEPYDHPKEVYVEEETNNLYWPQDKSFWVRLATSPRKDAPSFLLKKVDSKSLASSEEYNKEGIKLELSGNQFIRWYHYIKKDTLRLKFFSDGDPPSLSIEFSGAPKYEPGNNVFYIYFANTLFDLGKLIVSPTYSRIPNPSAAPNLNQTHGTDAHSSLLFTILCS